MEWTKTAIRFRHQRVAAQTGVSLCEPVHFHPNRRGYDCRIPAQWRQLPGSVFIRQ
jgi:hypothetical protein